MPAAQLARRSIHYRWKNLHNNYARVCVMSYLVSNLLLPLSALARPTHSVSAAAFSHARAPREREKSRDGKSERVIWETKLRRTRDFQSSDSTSWKTLWPPAIASHLIKKCAFEIWQKKYATHSFKARDSAVSSALEFFFIFYALAKKI